MVINTINTLEYVIRFYWFMLSNFWGKSLEECLIFVYEIGLCLEHQTEEEE